MKILLVVLVIIGLASCERKHGNITVSELLYERDNLIKFYNDSINVLNQELKSCAESRAQDTSKELKVVYEGYVHPSGNYKWTSRGWQELKSHISDSSVWTFGPGYRQSEPEDAGPYTPTEKDSVEWWLKGRK